MENNNTEPMLSRYLHSKGCRLGLPISGNFELTPRCNFNCKMCYVHLSEEEQCRRGKELSADEWLAAAEKARDAGMVFLLLTGGEPLVRQDFRYLLAELKKMGLMVSINSNGSLINDDWIEFFKSEPPIRFNITLYGAGNEAYERLCGRPVFDKVVNNIRALKEIGIGVKLNVSLTRYNAEDMAKIYEIADELGTPIQLATYMFPPTRRDEKLIGQNDRFSAKEAAEYGVEWDKLRFTDEQFLKRAEAMRDGLCLPAEDVCDGAPGEGILCRAGRSSFWINWQGAMTPCGMMTEPAFSVPELGFDEAWARTKSAASAIRLPADCVSCKYKNACHACAAMCVTETGKFDKRPDYVCEMTRESVRLTLDEYEKRKKNED